MTDAPDPPETVEELQRALRIQGRALERSHEALVRLEEYKDKNNILLRRVIAEMHEAQSEVKARNDELRATQARLVESERGARAASEFKSSFLANMSHEIRTPLNGVLGVAELLGDMVKDPAQVELVEIIQRSGKVLLEIIGSVLDLAKIEAGKVVVTREGFDLVNLLGEISDLFAPNAEDKGLQLVIACSSGMPRGVEGDPRLLRQVISNLVNNAIKFTSEGEVVVAVAVDESDGRRARLRFEVRDTGLGIPEAQLGEIFEAFTQVDTSSTRAQGGTGLGLAISRHLVEILGGELDVRSEETVGSQFFFSLEFPITAMHVQPKRSGQILLSESNATLCGVVRECLEDAGYTVVLAPIDEVPKDLAGAVLDWTQEGTRALGALLETSGVQAVLTLPWSVPGGRSEGNWAAQIKRPPCSFKLLEALEASGSANRGAHAQPARILVAEDNAINQRVVVGLLKQAGYSCDLVGTGREAVEACAATDYDLVFMDCQMPEMDGVEATEAIRSTETQRTAILALTAGTGTEERQRCLDAGMDDFLVKPIGVDALRRILDRYLA
jgi:signal transduction histidine kinase/CheY-like chemotaxis protein